MGERERERERGGGGGYTDRNTSDTDGFRSKLREGDGILGNRNKNKNEKHMLHHAHTKV